MKAIMLLPCLVIVGAQPYVAMLYQTTEKPVSGASSPDRLALTALPFNASSTFPHVLITVDPNESFQELVGFGGAITDASAHVFAQLPAALQEEVLDALWGADGQQYSLARLTIGSTDFATTVYNYDSTEGDFNLSHFSIEHDEQEILPMVKRAQGAAAGALHFISSPWSPPGWMKAGWLTKKGYMRNSAKPGMLADPKIHAT